MQHTRTTVMTLTVLLLGTLAAPGCLEELPSPSIVASLRVLGIQADPPEANPGTTVNLTAIAVDYPDQREISYRWAACLLPERAAGFFGGNSAPNSGGGGYGLDDPGNCVDLLDAGAPDVIDLGDQPTAQLSIGADFFDDLGIVKAAYGLPEDAPIPDVLLTGLLAIAGMNLTVTLKVQAGDDVLTSFKRVNISLAFGDAANANPTGLAFQLYRSEDEASLTIPKTAEVPGGNKCFVGEDENTDLTVRAGTYEIAPLNLPDPAIEYQVILPSLNAEEPFELLDEEETYFHSFFSTQGTFGREIIKATANTRGEWELGEITEPIPVWIVTRDGRGGLAWCHSMLQPE